MSIDVLLVGLPDDVALELFLIATIFLAVLLEGEGGRPNQWILQV